MPAETVAPPLPPTRNTRKRPAPATEDTEQTAVEPRDRKQGSKLRGEGPSKRLKTTHLPSKPSSSAGRAPTAKRRISARLQKQSHASQGSTSKKAPTRSSSRSQTLIRSQGHRDHTAVHGQTDQSIPAGRKPGLLTESSKSGKLPAVRVSSIWLFFQRLCLCACRSSPDLFTLSFACTILVYDTAPTETHDTVRISIYGRSQTSDAQTRTPRGYGREASSSATSARFQGAPRRRSRSGGST